MRSKNILIFGISLRRGGAERVMSILVDYFVNKDDINIYLVLLDDEVVYKLPQNVKPIILSKKEKNGIINFLLLPYLAYKLALIARKKDIHTIISFLYRPNYIAVLSKFFRYKGKVIINIRSTTSRYLKEGFQGKVNLFLIRKLFNKADLIISNSLGVKEDLNNLINIKTRHISIPNPIDLTKIEKLKNLNVTKQIDNNIDYIISVGRLIPLKRNKDLILAFSQIYKQLENTKLLFLGNGSLMNELINYSKKLGIEDKVIFLGNVDNPFYYLSRSKLFVMTSEIEGFPNVLIEAMACGLPVISSNCKSGPSEILDKGKYGLLFEVGDVKTLSKYILTVLKNDDIREKYKKLSIERVKNYDVDLVIKRFEKEIL